eukprot:12848550-Alexandrium_andersonii.AAC.1
MDLRWGWRSRSWSARSAAARASERPMPGLAFSMPGQACLKPGLAHSTPERLDPPACSNWSRSTRCWMLEGRAV